MFPKGKILELFNKELKKSGPPNFEEPDEPHGVLADLPLPVYMTTNYDDFMVKALESRGKDPKREMCRWNKYIKEVLSVFDRDFHPTAANPVVFHFHGHNKHEKAAESLVLTEDDYLEFLVKISRDLARTQPRIQEALTGASLLFIGYRLVDWDFRVLFRGLIRSMQSSLRRMSFTVQIPPAPAPWSTKQKVQIYLDKYFDEMKVRVYWGKAKEFAAELRKRWEEFSNGG